MANIQSVEVTKIVDGDTFHGHLILKDPDLDLDEIKKNQEFRFLGVNTPERNRKGYDEAKEFVAKVCTGKTLKIALHGKDVFDRWLVDVFYTEDNIEKSLNQELLRLGLAVVWVKK